MTGQIEKRGDPGSATENSASDDEIRRITALTDRVDQLKPIPKACRRFEVFVLGSLGVGFGAKAILSADWPFLFQTLLIFGLALGLTETVIWWYARKIAALEGEVREVLGPGS